MIVNNLNLISVAIAPVKADAPTVVDPNAVLSFAVPGELLQPIPRGHSQVRQGLSVIEHAELAICDLLDINWEMS